MAKNIEINDKELIKFRKRVNNLENISIRAGIVGTKASTKHTDSNLTNVQIGTIHEFGAPKAKIPARSFIRAPFDENVQRYAKLTAKAIRKVLKGAPTILSASIIGEAMRGDMVKAIKDKIPPRLKKKTIEAKGGETTPLVDTGQLVGSLSFNVKKGRL